MSEITAYIALGSNLGDRAQHLDQALQFLAQSPGVAVVKVSAYHETAPVGGPAGQGPYLNAAAELHTTLAADQLLRLLLDIENKLGRVRREHHGPRTVDLDLLLFGQEKITSTNPDLIVPHPRMHERLFVLEPLAQIAPLAVHPVLGSTDPRSAAAAAWVQGSGAARPAGPGHRLDQRHRPGHCPGARPRRRRRHHSWPAFAAAGP